MKNVFSLILVVFTSLTLFSQNDSSYYILQQEIKSLRTQRLQDSLKMDLLTQELQHFFRKATESTNTKVEKARAEEDSLRIEQQLAHIKNIKASTDGAPIIVENDTLFKIYASLGPFNALERAKTTNTKIASILDGAFYHPDSLKIINSTNITTINYQRQVILAIDELDALWENSSVEKLAKERLELINDHVLNYRKNHSFSNKLKSIGELIIILGVYGLFIFIINKLFRRLKLFLLSAKWFKNGIEFKNYELAKRSQLHNLLDKILTLAKVALIIVVFFSTLPFILKPFPQISRYSEDIRTIIYEPIHSLSDSIFNYLPNLIRMIIILALIRFVLKILKYFTNEIEMEKLKISAFYPEWAKPTYQIARFLLIIFALILVFPLLPGSGTIAFQGVTVFLGVLISIGSSSPISNAIAGIVITYMRPFQKGDWIKTGEIIGIVIEKNALVTRLKTFNNEDVTIPNSSVLSGATVNYSSLGKTYGLSITVCVDVKYSVNEDVVTKHLLKAAKQTKGISNRRPSYVIQISLNEINATYEINAITYDPKNMYFIKSDLVRNIHKVFKEAEIPLASVQFIDIQETKNEP